MSVDTGPYNLREQSLQATAFVLSVFSDGRFGRHDPFRISSLLKTFCYIVLTAKKLPVVYSARASMGKIEIVIIY